MKQWIIYKHTSLRSGKSYIGLTCNSLERRWIQHTSDARKGSNLHFHRAIRLYGEDNWTHEVIADKIDTIDEANALEQYYIKKFDTFENGYNLTDGGGSTHTCNGPTKHKEEITWIHAEHGVEVCTPWYLAKKYDLNSSALVTVSLNTNNVRMYKGWQLFVEGQAVLVEFKEPPPTTFYHSEYGEEFCTAAELAAKYNLLVSNVRKVIAGTRNKVGGWRVFKEEVTPNLGKTVYVYSLDYTLLRTYNTSFEASRELGYKDKRVSGWLIRNEEFEHKGLIYSYNLIEGEI